MTVTPVTCEVPLAPETTARRPMPRLRASGRWLWRELVDRGDPAPEQVALIVEACRMVDRLDRLDAITNGKDRAWLQLEVAEDGVEMTVIVDKVLGEARQLAVALKQIMAELRQAGAVGKPAKQGVGVLDQLAAARAKRLADAAGS